MKKIILFFLLFVNFLYLQAFCENFYIENYDIDIKVSNTRLVHVIENIDAYFIHSSHGIFRNIPLKNHVKRTDGTNYINNARISNIKVNEQYTTSFLDDNFKIKIGNPDTYVKGYKKYRIEYDYQLSNSKQSKNDEFYFNIIGSDWKTKIEKVNFKVTMPKSFESDKTGLSVGRYGSVGFKNDIQYTIFADSIEGHTLRTLKPKEAITLRIELPKDYFQKNSIGFEKCVSILITLVLCLLSYFIWFIYGKDDKVVPVVNFYPPKGMSSAELGVAYKDRATSTEVASLIVYLASKGYIKINNQDNEFILEKIKEYDGNKTAEKKLMDALFPLGKNLAYESELKVSKTFYLHCEEIIELLDKGIRKYIFEKDSLSIGAKIIPIISIIIIAAMFLWSLCDYMPLNFNFDGPLAITLVFPLFAIFTLFTVAFAKRQNIIVVLFIVLWSTCFGLIPPLSFMNFQITNIENNIGVIVLYIVAIIVVFVCLYQMPKRNALGNKLLGNIAGFKKFLQTAEYNRLRILVKQNPVYCYDILPYAYVLGVSKEWIEKFETIINYKPIWYSGDFDYHTFSNLARSIRYVSEPSVSNGGVSTSSSSSGGGGFSGGGCGGGGGGSW